MKLEPPKPFITMPSTSHLIGGGNSGSLKKAAPTDVPYRPAPRFPLHAQCPVNAGARMTAIDGIFTYIQPQTYSPKKLQRKLRPDQRAPFGAIADGNGSAMGLADCAGDGQAQPAAA